MNKCLSWCLLSGCLVLSITTASGSGPADPKPAVAAKPDSVLLQVMEAELSRAMSSLGTSAPADPKSKSQPQPKPYFMSYEVSDSDSISLSAQFGALSGDSENRHRSADIQVRLGSEAEDNTHGTHRPSALTTMPLPLSDDREALARSLWYATNRGYGRALDSFLQVKTEQQVRAKEEDSSADFSKETPATALVPIDPKFAPGAPLMKDKPEWESRLRELSGLFKQFPDVFYNTVNLQASEEVDYFVSSDGARVSTPSHVARLVIVARSRADDGMDLYRVETFESDELG